MLQLTNVSEKLAAAVLALVLSIVTINGTVSTPQQASNQFAGAYVSVVA